MSYVHLSTNHIKLQKKTMMLKENSFIQPEEYHSFEHNLYWNDFKYLNCDIKLGTIDVQSVVECAVSRGALHLMNLLHVHLKLKHSNLTTSTDLKQCENVSQQCSFHTFILQLSSVHISILLNFTTQSLICEL